MTIKKGIVLLVKIAAALCIFVVAVFVGAYWWSNIPPSRPKGLSANAVWLWAPAVGLPAPKRGTWLSCRVERQDGMYHCKTSDKDGRTLYEGVFLPSKQESLASESELSINIEQMRQDRLALFIEGELVPLVHLKNGNVLIPAARYEDGRRLLDAP